MNEAVDTINRVLWRKHKRITIIVFACLMTAFTWPQAFIDTTSFVLMGMLSVSVLVVPGILISAWVNASGSSSYIKRAFEGNKVRAIFAASLIGAITPVCGVTVLPLMVGLLSSGIPLAPVMAFWLSSPITDPANFFVTAATLGFHFAIAKIIAALLIGIFGGLSTATLSARLWIKSPLKKGGLVAMLGKQSDCESTHFEYAIWNHPERIARFNNELWAMTKLIVICLSLAFAAEDQMQAHIQPETFVEYVGKDSKWAIPLAVLVGSPAYLDSYAALPLTRGLIDHGMSPGAAMAFLVSGSVVSIWGAIAIFPALRFGPFMFYLTLAAVGSMTVGWIYDWIA
jgi:uncharacterized membrane protein YraQ (UPF0718 family)